MVKNLWLFIQELMSNIQFRYWYIRWRKTRERNHFRKNQKASTRATNFRMARLARQKANEVKCICISCGQIYFASNMVDFYYCPLCGAEQEDYEEWEE